MQVSAEEVAATEVPPIWARPCSRPGACWWCVSTSASCAAFDQDLDRIGVIPGASVYPFVWNILLAARNEGFGGVLTTVAVAEEPRVKELLGIPDDYAIAALLPIGKPVKAGQEADAQARLRVRHLETIRRRAAVATSFLPPWRRPSSASCTPAPSAASPRRRCRPPKDAVPALP